MWKVARLLGMFAMYTNLANHAFGIDTNKAPIGSFLFFRSVAGWPVSGVLD